MAATRISIRIDLASGNRIGPGKIALVEEINHALREPAVTAETGGRRGGGAIITPVGERVVGLYRTIEAHARSAAVGEFRTIAKLVRPTPA
jgi:molybdate transport system regulatory protein